MSPIYRFRHFSSRRISFPHRYFSEPLRSPPSIVDWHDGSRDDASLTMKSGHSNEQANGILIGAISG
jgi:hypothetical protein